MLLSNPERSALDRRTPRWPGWVLAVTVLLCAPAYSFHLVSFLHAKELVLCLGLVATAAVTLGRGYGTWNGFRALLPLWCGLAAVTLAGLAGAAHLPARTVEEGIRWTALLLLVCLSWEFLRSGPARDRVLLGMVLSGVLVSMLGILQYLGLAATLFPSFPGYDQPIYSVFGNQDLLGGYVAVTATVLITQIDRSVRTAALGLAALGVLLTALVLTGSRSAWLAAAVGLMLGFPWRRVSLRRGMLSVLVVIIAAGGVAGLTWEHTRGRLVETFSRSDVGGNARLWFWDGTTRMICAHPWLGVGHGNYRYWSPHYLGEALQSPEGESHFRNELHTLHAHSEPLEYFAETGFLGVLFALWMAFRLAKRRWSPAWAGLISLLVFSGFNAALHSVPHALAGFLLLGMAFQENQGETVLEHTVSRKVVAPLFGICVLVALAHLWTVLIPSVLLRAAEDVHVGGGDPIPHYERALEHPWPNAVAQEEYGIALFDADRTDDAYAAFRLALEGLDTGRLHLLLGITAAELNRRAEAQHWLEKCLERWPGNKGAEDLLWRVRAPDERKGKGRRGGANRRIAEPKGPRQPIGLEFPPSRSQ